MRVAVLTPSVSYPVFCGNGMVASIVGEGFSIEPAGIATVRDRPLHTLCLSELNDPVRALRPKAERDPGANGQQLPDQQRTRQTVYQSGYVRSWPTPRSPREMRILEKNTVEKKIG